MPWIIAGGALLGGLISSSASESAASTQAGAAEAGIAAQERATQAGIAEQRRQFDEIQKLLAPYVQAGQGAIGGFQPFQAAGQQAIGQFTPYQQAGAQAFEQQQALAGLQGPEAQQAAISQIESSPFLQSQIEQGERALLQRASATGGLRGGNLQAALAQFRPQMLQQAIEQQYGRLGGFAGTGLGVTEAMYRGGLGTTETLFRGGQAAAAGQAAGASTLGQGIAGALQQQGAGTSALLQQQGAAQAGGQLAGAAPFVQAAQFPLQLAGMNYARTGEFGFGNLFGGGASQAGPVAMPGYGGMYDTATYMGR